jgi:hypothetical protein
MEEKKKRRIKNCDKTSGKVKKVEKKEGSENSVV